MTIGALLGTARDLGVTVELGDNGTAKLVVRDRDATPAGLLAEIKNRKPEVVAYLNRLCNRCGAPAYLCTYWHERLCQPCARLAAVEHDKNGTWPEPPWSVNE